MHGAHWYVHVFQGFTAEVLAAPERGAILQREQHSKARVVWNTNRAGLNARLKDSGVKDSKGLYDPGCSANETHSREALGCNPGCIGSLWGCVPVLTPSIRSNVPVRLGWEITLMYSCWHVWYHPGWGLWNWLWILCIYGKVRHAWNLEACIALHTWTSLLNAAALQSHHWGQKLPWQVSSKKENPIQIYLTVHCSAVV